MKLVKICIYTEMKACTDTVLYNLKRIWWHFQVDNLGISDPKITLVEEQGKRHSQVEILDTRMGVLARPSARIFPPLYDELLTVHIGGDAGKWSLQNTSLKFETFY